MYEQAAKDYDLPAHQAYGKFLALIAEAEGGEK